MPKPKKGSRKNKVKAEEPILDDDTKITEKEEKEMVLGMENFAVFCRLAKCHGERMGATCLAMFSGSDDFKETQKKWSFLEDETRKMAVEITKKIHRSLKGKGEDITAQVIFLTALRLISCFVDDTMVSILEDAVKKAKEKQNKYQLDYAR